MLAGFPDGRADEGPTAVGPSLLGLNIARERGWSAPPVPSPSRDDEDERARRPTMVDPADPGADQELGRRAGLEADQLRATRAATPALRTALAMTPADVVTAVKDSGLRGRGGAGFPTGMKWSFIPQDNPKPKYLVVNADESEPGTCKDIPLMMASPHTLVEGVIIAAYAIRANHAFIYVRGEVLHVVRRLQQAVREAYSAGYAGHQHPRHRLRPGDRRARRRRARTSAARRPRCWTPWRVGAASRGCGRRSRPSPACTPARP